MTSKPSWDDAPKWANYLAQDLDGTWCWYEGKQVRDGDRWDQSERWRRADLVNGWENTLETRPKPLVSINWDAVPERWNYFAIDNDGQGFFFAEKPEYNSEHDGGRWLGAGDDFDCKELVLMIDASKFILERPK